MKAPQWLEEIRERAEAVTAHAKKYNYELNQESMLRNRIALEAEGIDQEYCDIYANSTVDIPALLSVIDKLREALISVTGYGNPAWASGSHLDALVHEALSFKPEV